MNPASNFRTALIAAGVGLIVAAGFALASGPVMTDWRLLFAFWLPGDWQGIELIHRQVVTDIRLPRLLLGMAVGCVLAQAGTAMQTLCRNPLADPSLIGISAGAATCALLVIALGGVLGLTGSFWITTAAFIGALVATYLVYKLADGPQGLNIATVLLAGVAINALAGAVIGLLSYVASDDALRLMSFWQLGSLAGVTWEQMPFGLSCMGLSVIMLWWRRRALNTLLLGERQASYMGVNTRRLKQEIIVWVALGVGGSVALTGMIGFVGLVIPHIARLLVGAPIPRLMPVAMLLGAGVLVVADWLARFVVAPAELPIGIITALLGAPFFIYLLVKQKRRLYA